MTTADIIDHLLRNFDEVVFPALAAYVAYLLRTWVQTKK